MKTATIVTHGTSQSVCLPAEFHLDGNEVYVKHLGKSPKMPTRGTCWPTASYSSPMISCGNDRSQTNDSLICRGRRGTCEL